jgi:cobalt-zinc-cadmium efflux system membrane fusion protein
MGETVNAGKSLFTVADTRRMWLTLHVPFDSLRPFREKDPRRLLGGKPVRFKLDTGDEVSGNVAWISTAVDEKTHTLQVRAELPNADGRLRANVFGAGRIVLRVEERAVTVPNEAVHWDGKCNVVFVRDKASSAEDAPKVFHVRSVVPGVKDARNTEIIAGLLPGEQVATRNSNVLRAELLKASLGEG